jgi:alanyl-tRNA synthetase
LVGRLAPIIGGRGGGKPNFAQAGGKDAAALPDLIAAIPEQLEALGCVGGSS